MSVTMETFQPSPTAPRRWSSLMRTSVKYTSLKPDFPEACLIGRISTPGAFMFTMNMVRPWCLGTEGSVRVRRIP